MSGRRALCSQPLPMWVCVLVLEMCSDTLTTACLPQLSCSVSHGDMTLREKKHLFCYVIGLGTGAFWEFLESSGNTWFLEMDWRSSALNGWSCIICIYHYCCCVRFEETVLYNPHLALISLDISFITALGKRELWIGIILNEFTTSWNILHNAKYPMHHSMPLSALFQGFITNDWCDSPILTSIWHISKCYFFTYILVFWDLRKNDSWVLTAGIVG